MPKSSALVALVERVTEGLTDAEVRELTQLSQSTLYRIQVTVCRLLTCRGFSVIRE